MFSSNQSCLCACDHVYIDTAFCFLAGSLIEKEVFKQHYDKLASILPVANILHKLVPEGIITTDDIEEINDEPRSKVKASFILNKINRSLEADAKNSFYALLDIMEECGNDDVKSIVIDMRRMLMTGELIVTRPTI